MQLCYAFDIIHIRRETVGMFWLNSGRELRALLACVSLISAVMPSHVFAAPAANIDFSIGDVTATSPDGTRRNLAKGADVIEGDLISTNSGRAQLRFSDGAYVSLQPQTDFKVEKFRFEGKTDGTEMAVLRLLKGGLRTITGLVGRRNRPNYQLHTTVATIGIRGTEFSVVYGNSITVTVGEGAVEACNAGGCMFGVSGQTLYVANFNTIPVVVNKKADLPPAPAPQQRTTFAKVEDRSTSGGLDVVPASATTITTIPVVPLANGSGGMAVAAVSTSGTFGAGLLGGTLTFGSNGALTQSIDCCTSSNNFTAGVSSDFGADGIISWGRWTSGVGLNGQPLLTMSYIGILSANAVTAPNIIRGYASFASTAPVVTSGGTIVAVGATNSVTGSLNVNFSNLSSGGSLTYALSIPVAGQTFNINGSASQYSGTGFLGSSSTITSTGAGCTPSCSGNIPFGNAIQGAFTGAAAQRAGANYGFSSQIGQVSGAIVFK